MLCFQPGTERKKQSDTQQAQAQAAQALILPTSVRADQHPCVAGWGHCRDHVTIGRHGDTRHGSGRDLVPGGAKIGASEAALCPGLCIHITSVTGGDLSRQDVCLGRVKRRRGWFGACGEKVVNKVTER